MKLPFFFLILKQLEFFLANQIKSEGDIYVWQIIPQFRDTINGNQLFSNSEQTLSFNK